MNISLRAFVGVNDAGCPWPDVSRERLIAIDPTMHALIETLFAECDAPQSIIMRTLG